MLESGNRPNAKSPSSSAFGLYQLLKGNRVYYGKICGVNPDTLDYAEQVCMGKKYIQDAYGTSERAYNFWIAHRYY